MSPIHTPTTRTYSLYLRPSWHKSKGIESQPKSLLGSEGTSVTNGLPHPNVGLYGRAIGFILVESSFLIFSYYCLYHPIPLQSNPHDGVDIIPSLNITLTELKAGITAISVVWHALACLLIGDIIAGVRSAEFMAQYHRHGGLGFRTSDKVSTLTSGIIDVLLHFFRGSPTRAFRLAAAAMVVLMVVGPLGSGTITVGTATKAIGQQIQITNMSVSMVSDLVASGRANHIMSIEREENTTFKYDMKSSSNSDPILIPWPTIHESLPEQATVIYQSDILTFRTTCSWINTSLAGTAEQTGVGPVRYTISDKNQKYVALTGSPSSISGYHIVGLYVYQDFKDSGNILFVAPDHPTIADQQILSMSELPNVFNVTNDYTPLTGAILHCSPSISIAPATVTLEQNVLLARMQPEPTNGSTLIGNIPSPGEELLHSIFRQVILTCLPCLDEIFLRTRRTIKNHDQHGDTIRPELEPLPPDEMAANIDLYLQSSAKAYLSGIVGVSMAGIRNATTLLAVDQMATVTFPVAALVTSKPFLFVFTAIIGFVIVLLAALLWTICGTELKYFNLENLVEILGSN